MAGQDYYMLYWNILFLYCGYMFPSIISSCLQMNSFKSMYLLSFCWFGGLFLLLLFFLGGGCCCLLFFIHLIRALDDGKIFGTEIMHESYCMKLLLWGVVNQASKQNPSIVQSMATTFMFLYLHQVLNLVQETFESLKQKRM